MQATPWLSGLRAQLGLGPLAALPREFYARDTVTVARALLGKVLAAWSEQGVCAGRIVEAEAYLGEGDPAAHAYSGKTARNAVLFGPPGTAYVFLNYGIHWCFNVVTEPEGRAGCALVRALEPLAGIDLMQRRRNTAQIENLASGPGKLTQALAITRADNGADLLRSRLLLLDDGAPAPAIAASPRVGIRKAAERPLRFFVRGSRFVSPGHKE